MKEGASKNPGHKASKEEGELRFCGSLNFNKKSMANTEKEPILDYVIARFTTWHFDEANVQLENADREGAFFREDFKIFPKDSKYSENVVSLMPTSIPDDYNVEAQKAYTIWLEIR